MADRPSDRALSVALETLDQIGAMTKRGRASLSARATAVFIRTQLEPATTNPPEIGSKSVVEPTAEHWRRAIQEKVVEVGLSGLYPEELEWIEQRARSTELLGE